MYKITITKNENPLLNEVIIFNKELNFTSSIFPNLGASLQKLDYNGIEIIDGISANDDGLKTYKNKYNSAILFPFPNRISDGKFEFNNTNYNLEINEPALNNRLHGFVFNKSFVVKEKSTSKENAKIVFNYKYKGSTEGFPFPYNLELTYTFTKNKVSLNFGVLNEGTTAFPFGIGWHPYFKVPNLKDSTLAFEAKTQYLVNKKMIPTEETRLKFKTPILIRDTFLDDCFITEKSTTSLKTDSYTIDINFSSKKPTSFLQVYTPESRDCIAIEPMTCAPNSFNNKSGLLILEANEKYNWKVDLEYYF
ncbi:MULTISPECIES: aldose 1-epimerase [Flavobacteriaceae]|uniref:Aldose 1-epimerase n=2 Tax=Flavobacteriaceae TaxID=49546 RepID=A0A4Y8AXA8_9FLAO|nr:MULTISPECIES: aldose 1-epimerase [Flavobacteriaceae]TEW77147.1 aldose 1-epimerase [Gramella jeungdoensis]GGK57433.1 aldose 1-epimerase [Lutibacter litoralis]